MTKNKAKPKQIREAKSPAPEIAVAKWVDGDCWYIIHVPTSQPLDGFYHSQADAEGVARLFARDPGYLQERLKSCKLERVVSNGKEVWKIDW